MIINENLDVTEEIIPYEKASKLFDLKRVEQCDNPTIRIIKIGDDTCPCIGEHVSNTREIATFKITTSNFQDGVLRLRFKIKKEK